MTIPTQVNFNIPELFKQAFGLYARFPVYVLGDAKPGNVPPVNMEDFAMDAFKLATADFQNYKGASTPNGIVVWDQFEFKHPDLATGEPIYVFPLITTVEISVAKNIVKTPLIGSNQNISGTAKELMSIDDAMLTFRGLAINFEQPNQYPEDEVKALNRLFSINDSLPVASKILLLNDITHVVFTNKEFPPLEGYANVQPFEFTAISDNPIILDLF